MIIIHVYTAKSSGDLMATPRSQAADSEMLRSALHDYFERAAPLATMQTSAERTAAFVSAFQPGALLVPDELGGAGCSVPEALVVAAESGGALLDAAVLAALLASRLLTKLRPSKNRDEALRRVADGRIRVAAPVWLSNAGGPLLLAAPDATHALVFDKAGADVIVLLVDLADQGAACDVLSGIDPTRALCRLRRPAGNGVLLATGDEAYQVVRDYVEFARLAIASEQGAGTRCCVEMSVDYAKVRKQFGVPIASFQAVKHACATMMVNWVEGQAMVDVAAAAFADGEPAAGRLASQAKALMSEAFATVARSAIEVHGGVGFSWEHPVQLLYKRALATSAYFGAPDDLFVETLVGAQQA
jgi:alkylation response protein AidB-like acyl-CoA dehydrogenase